MLSAQAQLESRAGQRPSYHSVFFEEYGWPLSYELISACTLSQLNGQ